MLPYQAAVLASLHVSPSALDAAVATLRQRAAAAATLAQTEAAAADGMAAAAANAASTARLEARCKSACTSCRVPRVLCVVLTAFAFSVSQFW